MTLRTLFHSRRFWAAGLFLAGLAAAIIVNIRQRPEQQETVRVAKRDLVQEVLITGRVQARKKVSLGFEGPGTVSTVTVRVGQQVAKGELLAAVDARSSSAELARASATRASTLFDARLALARAERDVRDTQVKQAAALERRRQAIRDAKVERDQSEEVRQQVITERGDHASEAKNALLVLRRAESAYRAAQHALTEARADAVQAEHTAQAALKHANTDLTEVTQAAPDAPGLSVLDAEVALAQSRLRAAQLRSPIAGTVTTVNASEGELAAVGTPVVIVEALDELEIVADVPETDIAKLTVEQKAHVTFDAVKALTGLEATVARIDPSAVLIEGVPTYRVTLALAETDARLRPGMTADIRAESDTRRDVLTLPSHFLATRDGRTVALVRTPDGRIEEREVSTGLRSADGFVEITRDLAEGDEVLLSRERRNRAP